MGVFFIHIPKTAGTSFRKGVEEFFGKGRLVYDYGGQSPETSLLCLDHVYGRKDFWGFYQTCAIKDIVMVGGHMPAGRYMPGFGVGNMLTFVREPLQRARSEYGHHVRLHGFKGTFQDFYENPRTQNRMSKMLRGVPHPALGMIGVTERYADSLTMINTLYGWNIPLRTDNPGEQHPDGQYVFTAEDEANLRRLHHHDLLLYGQCVDLFEQRWRLFQAGLPFVHAQLTEAGEQRVSGWAWWAGRGDEPVRIDVLVNGQEVGKASALGHVGHLSALSPPRGGHVGFHLPISAGPGDRIQCRVSATGQMFPAQPRVVVASP